MKHRFLTLTSILLITAFTPQQLVWAYPAPIPPTPWDGSSGDRSKIRNGDRSEFSFENVPKMVLRPVAAGERGRPKLDSQFHISRPDPKPTMVDIITEKGPMPRQEAIQTIHEALAPPLTSPKDEIESIEIEERSAKFDEFERLTKMVSVPIFPRKKSPKERPQTKSRRDRVIERLNEAPPEGDRWTITLLAASLGLDRDTVYNDLKAKDMLGSERLDLHPRRRLIESMRSLASFGEGMEVGGLPEETAELFELLEKILKPDEYQFIIEDLSSDETNEEMAQRLGVSAEDVVARRMRILEEIRRYYTSKGLAPTPSAESKPVGKTPAPEAEEQAPPEGAKGTEQSGGMSVDALKRIGSVKRIGSERIGSVSQGAASEIEGSI